MLLTLKATGHPYMQCFLSVGNRSQKLTYVFLGTTMTEPNVMERLWVFVLTLKNMVMGS